MSGNFIVSSGDCVSVSCSQASPGTRQISTLVFLPPGSFPYSISFLPLKAKVLTLIIGLEEYLPSQYSYFTLKKIKNKKDPFFELGNKESWWENKLAWAPEAPCLLRTRLRRWNSGTRTYRNIRQIMCLLSQAGLGESGKVPEPSSTLPSCDEAERTT